MANTALETVSSNKAFEGELIKYKFKVPTRNVKIPLIHDFDLTLFSPLR